MLPIGLCAQLACIWEATAPKLGNVSPAHHFEDLHYVDFLVSAAAVAPILEKAPRRRVGQTILEAVQATRSVVATNTNLGILLLLGPLAAVPRFDELSTGLQEVLEGLDVEDAKAVYQAIRLAAPAGLGQVAEQDILTEPTGTLREIMILAAERDLVARQYANGFQEVLLSGVPLLQKSLERIESLAVAIVSCQLGLLSSCPDSLIARKRGLAEAEKATRSAQRILELGWPKEKAGWTAFKRFDSWLRAQGNSRNPGTTADLVTASLFILLREGIIDPLTPFHSPADFRS